MLKPVLESIIRYKNPAFRFHASISDEAIMGLIWQKAGMWLRAQRLWLRGRNAARLFLGSGVRFFCLSNVRFGRWVQLEKGVFVSALGQKPLSFGDNVRIGAYSRVITSTTFDQPGLGIRIGNNVGIGEFSYLGGAGGLELGDGCIIGQYFSTHPENHIFADTTKEIRLQGVSREGIRIGADCWIGSKVTVLDGVSIGQGSVVAAGAVVTKSFPAGSIIGGVPAKLIRNRSNDLKHTSIMDNQLQH